MSDEHRQRLRREGVAFFGEMGAGLSHELSNVFNIINELSGLQQDILAAAAEGGSAGLARVSDLAARVKAQIGRGEEINRSLHRLSHTVDSADVEFDLGGLLVFFGALEARAARLAEVALAVRPPETPMALHGDPFSLLMTLHACVKVALAAAAAERSIEVSAEMRAGTIRVIVSSADPSPDPRDEPASASALELGCEVLGMTAHVERDAGGSTRIVLEIGAGSADTSTKPGDREAEV